MLISTLKDIIKYRKKLLLDWILLSFTCLNYKYLKTSDIYINFELIKNFIMGCVSFYLLSYMSYISTQKKYLKVSFWKWSNWSIICYILQSHDNEIDQLSAPL